MTIHELPYRTSPFAHLCYLVSEALKGPVLPDDRAQDASAPKVNWLDRIDQWVWRQSLKRREAYLAQSTDLVDLERRMRDLDRPLSAHYS